MWITRENLNLFSHCNIFFYYCTERVIIHRWSVVTYSYELPGRRHSLSFFLTYFLSSYLSRFFLLYYMIPKEIHDRNLNYCFQTSKTLAYVVRKAFYVTYLWNVFMFEKLRHIALIQIEDFNTRRMYSELN